MLKVGITGGIGCGKTTVCRVFELLDVPVYYADDEAKKILDSNVDVKKNILKTFGNAVLTETGIVDRKKLASYVFNNKEQLKKLNSIVHPAVSDHFMHWLKKYSSQKYILKEAAILFESGAYKLVDRVIAVIAPLELKINRTMQRDKITRDQVLQRMSNQAKDEEIIKRSQFVIQNDEEQLIIPQILSLHTQLMES